MKTKIYDQYMTKVWLARDRGFSDDAIMMELMREKESIMPRCVAKQATLARDPNIYKRREAARSANECIAAIDQILKELEPKETIA